MSKAHWHESSKAVWEQHAELNAITGRLLAMANDGFDWFDLDRELTRLDRLLARHFALEEVGEYLRDVRERLPEEAPLIRRLGEAHVSLRETLRHMRHLAVDKENAAAVRDELVGWLDVLAEHEAAENRLLSLAFPAEAAAT
ncbi:MAG: hemerythrin domain-containing protein [Acidobacteriota bacterium]